MIRLFIAFGKWLKLNFNVLSGNFISLLSVDIEWHGRNESCWPKWPENNNWPSGPIFAQFDWPDRKYTGLGPAVTSTPAISFKGMLDTLAPGQIGTRTLRHLCETFRYQDKSAPGQIGICVFFTVVLAVASFWSLFNQNFLNLLSYKFFPADFRW